MTQEQVADLLKRFNGQPGKSEGLSHDETVALIQILIDNKTIYDDPSLNAFGQAYYEGGFVTGYDMNRKAYPVPSPRSR